jgi:hypothetical protein
MICITAIGTGESITGSTTTLPYTIGVTAIGTEKNGSPTIGVGTYTRFSSSRISRGTMLPLITSSSRKHRVLFLQSWCIYQDSRNGTPSTCLDSQ